MKDRADIIEVSLSVTDAAQSAPTLLSSATGLPTGRVKHAMQCGAVWLTRDGSTRRLRRAKRSLRRGDTLDLYYDPEVLARRVAAATLIDDASRYTVWDKPFGMWTHGSRWGDHCALTRYATSALARESLVVHRLDRATRGLILIAHDSGAAAALSALFRERTIDKQYRAVVSGLVAATGTIAIDAMLDDKVASSEVTVLSRDTEADLSVVDVRIHTGRKHQVRRHLAMLGHPVVGDRLYGNATADAPDLMLTAIALSFDCPLRKRHMQYRLAQPEG